MSTAAVRPRRWLRFSLRSLLLVVLLLCLGLAGLRSVLQSAIDELQAARAIENAGGSVRYEAGEDRFVRRWAGRVFGERLFDRVVMVHVNHDGDLTPLRDLRNLEELTLIRQRLTDEEAAHLEPLPAACHVTLLIAEADDETLERLRGVKVLRTLWLGGELELLGLHTSVNVSDSGLEALSGHTLLKELSVSKSPLTGTGLKHLAGFEHLETLILDGTAVTDDNLPRLRELPQLTRLQLQRTAISDAGMKHVAACMKLQMLLLSGTRVTDAGLAELAPLAGLYLLNLNDTQISDASMNTIAAMRSMQCLMLASTNLTDAGLGPITSLSKLRALDLKGTRITQQGLKLLPRCPLLDTLELSGIQVTDAWLALIAKLPELAYLRLDDASITDAGLAHLKGLRQLRFLRVIGDSQVTGAGVAALQAARPGLLFSRTTGPFEVK